MDDEVFPRGVGRNGDDLLQEHPAMGDHDPCSGDRQLLLDAVMAAQKHLIITYSGHDQRTNAERPPAVPIAELLDVIDRSFTCDGDGAARERVVRHHPLQGFDPRNFSAAEARPWGFDPLQLAGAETLLNGTDQSSAAFIDEPLGWDRPDEIGVTELARFIEEPVRGFVTRRLGFSLREIEARGEDLVPVDLGGLEAWAVGDRMLRGRMAGDKPADQHIAERRRGSLPPGALADAGLDDIEEIVAAIHATAGGTGVVGVGITVRIDCQIAGGTRLVGNVVGIHGSRIGVVQYSRLKAKHRIGAFVRVAALTRLDPDTAWDAVVIGKKGRDDVGCVRIGPLGHDPETRRRAADDALEMLTDLWDRGMREPLPIYPETTGAFAMARGDKSEWKKANSAWTTSWNTVGEDQDRYNRLVLGGVAPLNAFWDDRPRPDERGDDWPRAGSRFEAYALRLWTPLLAVMEDLSE
jgi:exodeoxyribonuclease V gamma subunit